MKLTSENTKFLNTEEFLDKLAIELWSEENIYLLNEPQKTDIPDYFYISAYLIEFETELLMQGLATLLTNSVVYNFDNVLEYSKIISCKPLENCLKNIIQTLQEFELKPTDLRENFLQKSQNIQEYDIINNDIMEENLYEKLSYHEEQLHEIFPQVWEDLYSYLKKKRGK